MTKTTIAILGMTLGVGAFAIPIPNDYLQCRSVKPVLHIGQGTRSYASVQVFRLGGGVGLIRYQGPIYTLGNTRNGMQRTLPERAERSAVLGAEALVYELVNQSAAQHFRLEIENPETARFPEEPLSGYLRLADGKPVGFETEMRCSHVVPNGR